MAQSTGVLVVANYFVPELNSLNVTGSIPLLLLAVYNSWAALLNYINALFIDRIGRIRILTIGLVSREASRALGSSANVIAEWLCRLSDSCHGPERQICWHGQ